jgi:hypothetical protein
MAGPGRRFKKGQSGNPAGSSRAQREQRLKAKALLDDLLEAKKGRPDLLATAIARGVMSGDATCIRLACEYRWGKPVSEIELTGSDGGPIKTENSGLTRETADFLRAHILGVKPKGK